MVLPIFQPQRVMCEEDYKETTQQGPVLQACARPVELSEKSLPSADNISQLKTQHDTWSAAPFTSGNSAGFISHLAMAKNMTACHIDLTGLSYTHERQQQTQEEEKRGKLS